ncbi:MAG TPA: DUF6064 family protein [Anaeromyxobacter sp.]
MQLPFTVEEFLSVFERYNRAIGPAPLFAYGLAAFALALAWRGGRPANRTVLAVLAAFWAMNGAGYHLTFFRSVNPAATAFGTLFLAQAALYAAAATRLEPLRFRVRATPRHALALALAGYAAIAYPILGAALGHAYPRAPLLGLAPCPTTIFTFAILLLAEDTVPVALYAIPFLWSLLGASAASQLGIREDWGLPVAGLAGTAVLVVRRRRRPAEARGRA